MKYASCVESKYRIVETNQFYSNFEMNKRNKTWKFGVSLAVVRSRRASVSEFELRASSVVIFSLLHFSTGDKSHIQSALHDLQPPCASQSAIQVLFSSITFYLFCYSFIPSPDSDEKYFSVAETIKFVYNKKVYIRFKERPLIGKQKTVENELPVCLMAAASEPCWSIKIDEEIGLCEERDKYKLT